MLILCEKDWFPTKTIHQLSIKEEKMLLLTVKIGKAKKDRNFFSLHDRWNSRHFFKLTLLVRGQNSRMLIKFLRSESGNPTISFPEPAFPLSQDKANVGPGTRLATRRTKSLLLNHLLSRLFLMFILYHFEPALKACFVLRTEPVLHPASGAFYLFFFTICIIRKSRYMTPCWFGCCDQKFKRKHFCDWFPTLLLSID